MPKPSRTNFIIGLLYGALGIIVLPTLLAKLNSVLDLPSYTTPELQALGIALILGGGGILGIALTEYFLYKQTPLPTEKPTHLVNTGAYKYSRNPMLVAAACVWLGQSLLTGATLNYAFFVVGCLMNHYHVVYEEEKLLEKMFGDEYLRYKKKTARYIPSLF